MKRLFYGLMMMAAAVAVAPRLSAQQPAGTDLAAFEAAIDAKPDDLKAGNDYRVAVIKAAQYDRAIAFFEKETKAHPQAANLFLNYGFAYVDKVPAAGAITQVILANNALTEFSKSLEVQASWIGLYTRGNSYLYWPKIFGRTPLGVKDLEAAMAIQKADTKKSFHVRVWVSLGDAYYKMEDPAKAMATWKEGAAAFPDNADLKARMIKTGDDLQKILDNTYDPNRRVDTNLQELWSGQ
jgi:tetratricopeptide (TPR) repeat protein